MSGCVEALFSALNARIECQKMSHCRRLLRFVKSLLTPMSRPPGNSGQLYHLPTLGLCGLTLEVCVTLRAKIAIWNHHLKMTP